MQAANAVPVGIRAAVVDHPALGVQAAERWRRVHELRDEGCMVNHVVLRYPAFYRLDGEVLREAVLVAMDHAEESEGFIPLVLEAYESLVALIAEDN